MNLKSGNIIWAKLPHERGGGKCRPYIIFDAAKMPFACVAVTTSPLDPSAYKYVALRFNAQGSTETKFKRECWACCDWIQVIDSDAVVDAKGHVSQTILEQIRMKVSQLVKDE